jgi:hypothetical protein
MNISEEMQNRNHISIGVLSLIGLKDHQLPIHMSFDILTASYFSNEHAPSSFTMLHLFLVGISAPRKRSHQKATSKPSGVMD